MSLLQSGVDISTIAILLGHESIETTHKYMVTDLKLKETALNKVQVPDPKLPNRRYHGPETILNFLKSL
jgi:integrase